MNTINEAGFTVLQLLVVVSTISIVVGIAVFQFADILDQTRGRKVEAEIEMMGRAIEQIEEDTDNYPETLEQLGDTTSPAESLTPWWGPYVSSSPTGMRDPWGSDYVYFFWMTPAEGAREYQLGNYPPGPPGGGWDKGLKVGWGDAAIPGGLWVKLASETDIPDQGFVLLSVGPDEELGTGDDIEYGTY